MRCTAIEVHNVELHYWPSGVSPSIQQTLSITENPGIDNVECWYLALIKLMFIYEQIGWLVTSASNKTIGLIKSKKVKISDTCVYCLSFHSSYP